MSISTLNVGQLFAIFSTEKGCPTYNPGRYDKASWGEPLQQIPPALADGWNVAHGAAVVVDAWHFQSLVQTAVESGEPINSGDLDQLTEFANCDDPTVWLTAQRDNRIKALLESDKSIALQLSDKGDDPTVITDKQAGLCYQAACGDDVVSYVVISAQRRMYAMPHTLALREQKEITEPYTVVAVDESKNFETLTDVALACLADNSRHTQTNYSQASGLNNACWLIRQDCLTERQLGERVGLGDVAKPDGTIKSMRGARQRVYRWANLNMLHPGLKIGERVVMQAVPDAKGKPMYVEGEFLPIEKLDKEAAHTFLGDRDIKENQLIKPDSVGPIYGDHLVAFDGATKYRKATQSEIESWFSTLFGGRAPSTKSKVVTPEELRNSILSRSNVKDTPIGDAINAILEGDKSFFADYRDTTTDQGITYTEAEVDAVAEKTGLKPATVSKVLAVFVELKCTVS